MFVQNLEIWMTKFFELKFRNFITNISLTNSFSHGNFEILKKENKDVGAGISVERCWVK